MNGFSVGDTAGDYQVIGILGAGGMGKVYQVRNTISDRVEAMKVLLPNLADEPDLADRFVREIKLLASLDHPNIAGLHTAMRLNNQLLMVMEFVEGRTLEDRLREGPLPPEEAVRYIVQVLAALGYAHQRGVVHRDIKPANMMVTPSGAIKLMDFGIAKAVADRRLTMTGTTLGSLYYMSPEQVKGAGNLDGRSDLYSVGIALYELVTGTRPFKGDSDYAIMVAHLEQQPVPPIQIDPKLPPALNEAIMMAIQKDPAQRFQTAEAFAAALGSLASQPAAVVEPAPVEPLPAPVRRSNRALYMTIGALVVLAVLALAATQLPRWHGTSAGAPPAQTAPAARAPAETPAAPAPAPQTPAPAPSEATAVPATPAAEPKSVAVVPPVKKPAVHRTVSPATSQPAAPVQQVTAPAPQPQPAAQQPEAPSAGLEEARERLNQLAPRATTAAGSLQNLEQQQARSGLRLRGDISASWRRMEQQMDSAESAIKRGDAAAAKKYLDAAERELGILEKFLNL